jgi:hypothetical protein
MENPAPREPETQDFVIREEPESTPETPRDDLDGRRIEQIAALRRGLYRTRSYCLIAMWGCFGAAVQGVWIIVRQQGWGWLAAAMLISAILLIAVGIFFLRKSRQLAAAARQAAPAAMPAATPDFTTLGDGTHIWKSLGPQKADDSL